MRFICPNEPPPVTPRNLPMFASSGVRPWQHSQLLAAPLRVSKIIEKSSKIIENHRISSKFHSFFHFVSTRKSHRLGAVLVGLSQDRGFNLAKNACPGSPPGHILGRLFSDLLSNGCGAPELPASHCLFIQLECYVKHVTYNAKKFYISIININNY